MRALARLARAEWGPLYAAVRAGLVERRLRAIPMTVAAVCLTALTQYVQNQPWGYQFVQNIGAVRAEDPLWLALLRTPLSSSYRPSTCPCGVRSRRSCSCSGSPRSVWAGGARSSSRTSPRWPAPSTRVGIALGPHGFLGLPASDSLVVDTGPSAAVVGLAVFLCRRYHAYVTAGVVVAAMVVEVLLKENLAGREHLAAIVAVLVLCGISELRHRPPGRDRTGSGSGLPPIQS